MSVRSGLAGVIVSVLGLAAIPVKAETLHVPGALVCTFNPVAIGALEADGSYRASKSKEPMEFTFAAIDVKARTAQVIGNAGAGPVEALLAEASVNFVEHTSGGNIMLTTVLLTPGAGRVAAIHSRHTAMDTGAVPSQYVGMCDVKG